jgi:hypothetical protein
MLDEWTTETLRPLLLGIDIELPSSYGKKSTQLHKNNTKMATKLENLITIRMVHYKYQI